MARLGSVGSVGRLICCSAIGAALWGCGSSVHTLSAKTSYGDGYNATASILESQKAQGSLDPTDECFRFAALRLKLSQDQKVPWVAGCLAALAHAHYVQVTAPVVTSSTLQRLAAIAQSAAANWSEPHPWDIRVALGTQGAAEAIGVNFAYDESSPRFVIALDGRFVCRPPACATSGGGGPNPEATITTATTQVPVMTMLLTVDPSTLNRDPSIDVQYRGIDMSTLGRVYALNTLQASIVRYVGPITRAVSYPEAGISLQKPPSSSQPSVSWETAFQSCSTGKARCDAGSSVTISLALATETQAGQANPDGSINPVMDHALVYVISQSGVSCTPVGPARGTTTTFVTYSCTMLNFIDARTDKVLFIVSSPGL